ncbi:SMEK domain-containing protein [Mucilaginibacter sp. X4EP1]|uniref:SMEK domain-containing protein n=1 Tax=Mucilaginibacter sp. X4EP1 TaxID=2723092 RepID=UPI0038F79780
MSNHNKLLVSIRDYLTRFQLQVKIATANSEYDINHHAENIIIPIFNIVFDASFRNANDHDKKNFESLDLIDDNKKHIGIQVTAQATLPSPLWAVLIRIPLSPCWKNTWAHFHQQINMSRQRI